MLEQLIADCRAARAADPTHKATREAVARAVSRPQALLAALGEPRRAEIQKLYHAADLTILNVIWAPRMTIFPHNHRMWAVIGLYTACSAAGGFLGRFIPGAFEEAYSWRGGYLAIATLNLVCLAVVVLLLPREKNFEKASSLAASIGQMLRHLRNPKLLATYAVGFGVMFKFG